ncbi:J domain-containing protein [Natrialbaceae archaeon A-CW1-1]
MSDLEWPDAFPRTSLDDRESYPGNFRVQTRRAFQNILGELKTWDGVTDVQLESGADHLKQNPNLPYANATKPDDPGVVAYFTKDGEQMAAACDRWDNLRDNAQDIYHYLHETRMQEQRGTVTAENEYQKLRLPSAGEAVEATASPYAVLEIESTAGSDEIRTAYRKRIKEAHPDRGGSETEFKRVQQAYETLNGGETA